MVCVGRWEWLPADWEGFNGLSEKEMVSVIGEAQRQHKEHPADGMVGVYTDRQFEDTFNQDLIGAMNTKDYFIKIY